MDSREYALKQLDKEIEAEQRRTAHCRVLLEGIGLCVLLLGAGYAASLVFG